MIPYLGELASGLSSIVWACALIFFKKSGERVSPFPLNLFKITLATPLVALTALALGVSLIPRDGVTLGLLGISALLGMSIGDMFILASLNRIGAGWTAVVNATYSPMMIGVTALVFGIPLTAPVALGAFLVALAVAMATDHRPTLGGPSTKALTQGLALGIGGQFLMACSMAMLKYPVLAGQVPVFEREDALFISTWRLLFGGVFLWVWMAARGRGAEVRAELRPSKVWWVMVPGALLGTYGAMILWILGMKEIGGSLVRAAVLNQSNVIVLPFLGAFFLKEALTPRKLIAVALAFTGATVIVLAR